MQAPFGLEVIVVERGQGAGADKPVGKLDCFLLRDATQPQVKRIAKLIEGHGTHRFMKSEEARL